MNLIDDWFRMLCLRQWLTFAGDIPCPVTGYRLMAHVAIQPCSWLVALRDIVFHRSLTCSRSFHWLRYCLSLFPSSVIP